MIGGLLSQLDPSQQPLIELEALCYTCRKRHPIRATPETWLARVDEWEVKHRGHNVEFISYRREVPRRFPKWLERLWENFNRAPWWLEFAPNTDLKLAYAASAAYTITLASLATSSTLVAGQESNSVDNSSNLYLDYLVGGKITTGTTPTTAKSINIFTVGTVDDTPTWPDVFDGTDSAETWTSVDMRNAASALLAATTTDNTSNRTYWFGPRSLANCFGGVLPKLHVLWVTHDTAVNLHATGSNHVLSYKGAYLTG